MLKVFLPVSHKSRSREGAWIEIVGSGGSGGSRGCRSREGAWIEILRAALMYPSINVAPVRERGLKFPEHRLPSAYRRSLP